VSAPTFVVEFGSVGPRPDWYVLWWDTRRDVAIAHMDATATASPLSRQYGPFGSRRLRVREVSS